MINTIIGKYNILRLIGEGGMASVYEAEHEMLGTKVAIKVLNPILSANAQIKERFRNEAKLMASLNHPNITKVIDFDEQPQRLSIILEFLEGEDLDDKIKREGALKETLITELFIQTLSAFQYAHEKGIVHRDIKPSNIFILPNGQVKILDFGIAKLFGQGNEMTQTGAQMGTPIYMSPEQVKGDKSIDHRSDIYSLGVTMYFAINGIAPYSSDTDSQFDIFTKIVHDPLPEFSIQSKFKNIVLKACQKNREDRYQNCSEWNTTLLKYEKNDHAIFENSQNNKTYNTTNEKTGLENKSSAEISTNASTNKKLYIFTIIKTISFAAFLFIFYSISKNEEEAYYFEHDNFEYWQYYRLEFTRGAALVSFIFISLTLFYLAFFFNKLINLGHKKWINIFRIIASIFMFAWSILLFTTEGAISVHEVEVAWYIYIALEILLSIVTVKKVNENLK